MEGTGRETPESLPPLSAGAREGCVSEAVQGRWETEAKFGRLCASVCARVCSRNPVPT